MSPYESPIPHGRNGFWQILRSEWTKFRTVPAAWLLVIGTAIAGGLFLLDLDYNEGNYVGGFHLTHRNLSGDGTITARVVEHDLGHPVGAYAGIIVQGGDSPLLPYTALFVTPERGTWMHSLRTEIRGSVRATTPRWLRLTRAGETVTGFESTDGTAWQRIGTIRVRGLREVVKVGLIVSGGFPGTLGSARFDNVTVSGESSSPPDWRFGPIGLPLTGGALDEQDGDVFVMRGNGNFPPLATIQFHNATGDMVAIGVLFLVPLVMAIGVVTMTSEYSRRMIGTTFAASPRRGKVLAAKAIVLGGAVVTAVALLGAFQMMWLWRHSEELGLRRYELFDPWVVGNVYGPALMLAGLALLGLAAGAFARRAAGGVLLAAAIVIGPVLLASLLPFPAGNWLERISPLFSGMALLSANPEYVTIPEPTGPEMEALVGRDLGPDTKATFLGIDYLPGWAGFGVLCVWAALGFAVAYWRLRRSPLWVES